jgi:hypothetical protein
LHWVGWGKSDSASGKYAGMQHFDWMKAAWVSSLHLGMWKSVQKWWRTGKRWMYQAEVAPKEKKKSLCHCSHWSNQSFLHAWG